MRTSWTRKVIIPLFASSIVACGDSVGPDPSQDYLDLALDFCSATGEFPVFFAYLNEGEGWTRVNGDAGRTFAFRASDKVGVAMVFDDGFGTFSTEVVFAKNEELEPLSGGACTELVGSKTVDGSVAGVATGDFAWVSMGLNSELVSPPPSTFTLLDIANAPIDLIAHAGTVQSTGDVPDAVIIRTVPASTTALAPLDFNSNEAGIPSANTLNITGLSASEDNLIDVFFSTPTTFDHPLFQSFSFTSATQTIHHVPSTMTLAGDLHMLDVYATTTDNQAERGETQWYRNAANKSVSLGSPLSVPTVTSIDDSPVRLRTQLQLQPEYNSFALVTFTQFTATVRSVTVIGTAGFFDSPSTWTLDVPDLTGVSGFPTASALQGGGTQTEYGVVAYGGGDLATNLGAPLENSSTKYAKRFSSTNTLLALRRGSGETRRARRDMRLHLAKRRIGVR
jgi:hypothetical protein